MSKSRGFTIWELLAVVIIILLVAAVAFRMWDSVGHEKSRAISCLDNEKQIGLAIAEYMQDYDTRLPPRQYPSGSGHRSTWRTAVSPYIKFNGVFRCPSNPGAQWTDFENDGFPRSYAVNTSDGGADRVGGPFSDRHRALRYGKIPHPEVLVVVVESTAAFDDFNPLFPGAFAQPTREHRLGGHLFAHDALTNVLFADGHAKSKRPLDLLPASGINPWTIDGSPYSAADLATAKSTLAYGLSQSKVDGRD